MAEWEVLNNPNVGYIIGRVKDESQPLHGGNVEYFGEYSDDKEELHKIADKLNESEV